MPQITDLLSFKAILFDYDQTITNSQKEVTKRTRTALKQAGQKLTVGLCTGRDFHVLNEEDKAMFDPDTLHVLNGGSQVISTAGDIFWQALIPDEIIIKLIQIADANQVGLLFKTTDGLFGNPRAIQRYEEKKRYIYAAPKPYNVNEHHPVIALLATYLTDAAIEQFQKFTDITCKVMTNYENELFMDITALDVTKAVGVQHWCEATGIDPAEVIGVGDSLNDVEFLQAVGYSIAMGNAIPEVKAVAKEVIETNNNEGVAQFLEQRILTERST